MLYKVDIASGRVQEASTVVCLVVYKVDIASGRVQEAGAAVGLVLN